MTELLGVAIILFAGLAIAALTSSLLARFGVRPEDEASRSRGFGDVLSRIRSRRKADVDG